MSKRKPKADVIQFPRSVRLDVRDALLNNQSDPQVPIPAELEAAIDGRARAMAEEAYQLCREHLRRRVAYCSECGYPQRVVDMDSAYQVLNEGSLADALTRAYREKLIHIVRSARSAARISEEFAAIADEVGKAAGMNA